MKKIIVYLLVLVLVVPAVLGDFFLPYLSKVYMLNLLHFFIPIVLVESAVAYFFLKKPKIWYLLIAFVVANVVSSILGFPFASFLPPGSKYVLMADHLLLIPAYIFTCIIEFPIIYLFIRKNDNALKTALIVTLLANLLGYLMIFLYMLFTAKPVPPPGGRPLILQ